MKEYHKINSVFKRDEKTKKFTTQFSQPEFEYLKDNTWIGTEKLDGTNIRVQCLINGIHFNGRTDNSQIPSTLVEFLRNTFTHEKIKEVFKSEDGAIPEEIILFGEGIGKGIQKVGSLYKPDGVDFVLFDVLVNDIYLRRNDVDDIAKKLNIKSVPISFQGTLLEAIELVKTGFNSSFGNLQAEGLVLVPLVEMNTRLNKRIITKLKTKDFV